MQQREKNKERKTTYKNKDESLKQIILSQRSQNKKKFILMIPFILKFNNKQTQDISKEVRKVREDSLGGGDREVCIRGVWDADMLKSFSKWHLFGYAHLVKTHQAVHLWWMQLSVHLFYSNIKNIKSKLNPDSKSEQKEYWILSEFNLSFSFEKAPLLPDFPSFWENFN